MDTQGLSQNHSGGNGQAPEPTVDRVQIDPAASAALAEAIKSAKQGLKPTAAPLSEAAAAAPEKQPARYRSVMTQAAVALVLIGTGWLASYAGTLGNRDAIRRLEAETARSQDILDRLSGDLASLKGTMEAFKETEQASAASASERVKLAEKVELLAVAVQEPGKKLSALEARFDRMESQILASLSELSAKPTVPATTAAIREETPAPKTARNEPVEGWVLREVYRGAALVEGRNRRLYEVMPGGILPGVGRVEAIERRGTRWVVLTEKGVIGSYR